MRGALTGENIHSVEKSDYLQRIDALETKAARTEELEAENRRLNEELERTLKSHRGRTDFDAYGGSEANSSSATFEDKTKNKNLTVDIEEYNRVREELIKLESDYGKLVWARDHLETKVREQKDSLRQWKEYRKSWILKHPNKRLSHLRPSSAVPTPPTTAEDCRSSSAPAPPALPEGLTPSLSGFSRSPSPRHNAPATPKDVGYQYHQEIEPHSRDRKSTSDGAGISQTGQKYANASDSGDITEADPESGGPAESMKIEPATGGSSPIVIFERSLKRRHSARASAQNIRVREDDQRHLGATPRTHPPKDEQISSPIPATPLLQMNGPHDSLDLDDVGGHLDTPRKRQRMAQERLRYSTMAHSTAAQDAENMLEDVLVAEYSRQFDSEHPAMDGERDKQAGEPMESDRTLTDKAAETEKKARRDERIARQHAHNDRVHQRLEAAERGDLIIDPPWSSFPSSNEFAQQPDKPEDLREVRHDQPHLASPVILQPRTVNATVLPRTSDPFSGRKRPCPPSRRDRGAAHVPILAEDGEGIPSNSEALKAGSKSKDGQNISHNPADKGPKAPPTHHRLGALLTKPSPEKSLLISEDPLDDISSDQLWTKTPVPRTVYHSRSKDPATPRSLPATKSELKRGPGNEFGSADFEPVSAKMDRYSKSVQPVTRSTKNVNVSAFRKPPLVDPSETQPEHEPFRARPVHRLGLSNFKLNPAHSTYAYHETVRKHDEKKLLSGCTDRHCPRCKDLRKHVISSGYKTAQKPGETEDDADRRLMQDFLGDNRRQLKSMSKVEKSDLLLEAKVREFANRFGCHRQAFSRSRDAPGTWNVDFPTTQEDADDRAAAEVIEREKVQERYWEAMRKGGKWIFADE